MGEAFTPDIKRAWVEIYGIISSTMIEGGEYDKDETESETEPETEETDVQVTPRSGFFCCR